MLKYYKIALYCTVSISESWLYPEMFHIQTLVVYLFTLHRTLWSSFTVHTPVNLLCLHSESLFVFTLR